MKRRTKALSFILAIAMCVAMMATTAFADTPTQEDLEDMFNGMPNGTAVSGGKGTTEVTLTAAATTFKVKVPTLIPLSMNSAGVVTAPTNYNVLNGSYGNVRVTDIEVTGKNDWGIDDFANPKHVGYVGAKYVALAFTPNGGIKQAVGTQIGTTEVDGAMKMVIAPTRTGMEEWEMGALTPEAFETCLLKLEVKAKASGLTAAATDAISIANVVFTVAWAAEIVDQST